MTASQTRALDRNARALAKHEPWFAETFAAARALLNSAAIDSDGLHFPGGITCGPNGCTCGNRACLHPPCWRIYRGT